MIPRKYTILLELMHFFTARCCDHQAQRRIYWRHQLEPHIQRTTDRLVQIRISTQQNERSVRKELKQTSLDRIIWTMSSSNCINLITEDFQLFVRWNISSMQMDCWFFFEKSWRSTSFDGKLFIRDILVRPLHHFQSQCASANKATRQVVFYLVLFRHYYFNNMKR